MGGMAVMTGPSLDCLDAPLVPTLRVGMHTGNSAISRAMHSHAERGNEAAWLTKIYSLWMIKSRNIS
jgi:hypothetical protein